ncbi:MAG: T9SS type A sorting domain-containing protein [Candidatus Kapabacteria bacterium]|nr:T9SS type A sorting domain-containing protein [Candidatus Kapabacteria bacterium]
MITKQFIAGNATLALYDMHGKEVLHIASQAFRVGTYSVTASLDAIPSGMYMLRLTGEGYARSVLVPVIR